jgi:large subunit ribosomal protein L23
MVSSIQKINQERLLEVLRKPVVTEKTSGMSANNQVVFDVSLDSNKIEIKQSIEALFNVDVEKVSTLHRPGKAKTFKGKAGKTKGFKRAIITLKKGQTIDLSVGVK